MPGWRITATITETGLDGDSAADDDAVATVAGTPRAQIAASREPDGDLVGKTLDRYQVLARLGAGGMGVVYAAHDPALDRKVALKVLPPIDGDRGGHLEARLRREAQALARLDHPNVVRVYDAGVAEHSVFIAMQLVDGTTLADHLEAAHPGSRRVLELFVAAGRGLAAAHAAGIVHRDVKPSNLLVDRAGNVYVSDFGLARGTVDDEPDPAVTPSSLLDESMTRDGAVLGTPLYMAPEQHRGEPATALSDQFGFCVSLWQALFDAHPFVAGRFTVPVACDAMARDAVIDPTRTRGVPPRVIRALRRGLRHAPTARWPSMAALIAVLVPRSRAGWLWGGLAVAGIAGGIALTTLLAGGHDPRAACRSGAERGAEVWPARAEQLRAAFVDADVPDAGGTADRVATALGRYTTQWKSLRLDACEAADDRGEVTPALRDMQLRCLDDDLGVARALIDRLVVADRRQLSRAVDAVAALPALDDCAAAALAPLQAPPATELVRISEIRTALGEIRVLARSERLDSALTVVDQAVGDAESIGYPPLVAEALIARARLLFDRGSPEAADAAIRAAEIATESHADRIAAEAYSLALMIAANHPDRELVATLTPVARSAARRTGDQATYGRFAIAGGAGAIASARYDEGIALCTEALAALDSSPIPDGKLSALSCLVMGHLSKGDLAGAVTWAERGMGFAEKAYGPGTGPMVGPMRKLASVRRRQGRFDDAVALYRASLAIDERIYGPDSRELIGALTSLAQLMHEARRTDDGLPLAERALAISQRDGAEPGQNTMQAHSVMAQLLRQADRRQEMDRHYQAALAIGERLLAADDVNLASLRFSYGSALAEDHQDERALALLAQSAEALQRAGNPRAVMPLLARAEILQARGRCAEAVPMFEAGVAALEKSGSDPTNLLIARLNLADCLWTSNVDRPRARALMIAVRAAAVERGEGGAALVEEVDRWQAAHR